MSKQHAKLSASGSSRWLNCPGSVEAEKPYPNKESPYAMEGTVAHEVAELCLKGEQDAEEYVGRTILNYEIDAGISSPVQEYLDYVRSFETKETLTFIEEQVDFSHVVPNGFGTSDAIIIDEPAKTAHVFDYKHGQGVLVEAFENSQGKMYCLGVQNEFDAIYDIETYVIHIVQPRKNSITHWEISSDDLKKFGQYVKQQAQLALSHDAPRVPGTSQCRWCKAAGDCKALMRFNEQIIGQEFDEFDEESLPSKDVMTIEDRKAVMDNSEIITIFINAVFASAKSTLEAGEDFPGYKLVRENKRRKWTDEAETVLKEKLGDKAFKDPQLIGITDAKKLLPKEEREKTIDNLTFTPKGDLIITPETDKRAAVIMKSVEEEFDDNSVDDL